ncbi:MAG: hypothetical protein RLZZ459_1323 [Cyanobacteriota bacterium]|jgi:S1-C subfamily serine protease
MMSTIRIWRDRSTQAASAALAGLLIAAYPCQANVDRLDPRVLRVGTAGSSGTAFILGPDSNGRCILLTAHHVIAVNSSTEPLEITGPGGRVMTLLPGAFRSDPSLDLAFSPVSSCQHSLSLPLARARAITVSTKVMIKGYPLADEGTEIPGSSPSTVSGRISQYNDAEGYDLSYDAATRPGYSGGPVIHADGSELMAMHGRTDSAGNSEDPEQRERLRVGGKGVSAPLIYRFLKANGHVLPRSQRAICLVGVC